MEDSGESKNRQEKSASASELIERCEQFGEAAIRFAKSLPTGPVVSPLISQFVRSSTSLGANYSEAQNGLTRREFFQRIGICQKEAYETKHWLRMIAAANEPGRERARELWREVDELHRIFSKTLTRRNDSPK